MKKYRLVYLKKGIVYGSMSTVPTDQDEPLIKRSVLDGVEKPDFDPTTGEADKLTDEAQDELLNEEH